MRMFDEEYFFLRKPNDERLPSLVPDENTADRRFSFERQAPNSSPLVFHNGWKDRNKKKHIVSLTPDILFVGADLLVNSSIREHLLKLNVPNMYLHPSVYIDDQDRWHENFWYLTFTDQFDCWDRSLSDYESDVPPVQLGGFELHSVYSYKLNNSLLDEVPLQDRLLFKMGGTLDGFIVCHASIASVFNPGGVGIHLQAISEY